MNRASLNRLRFGVLAAMIFAVTFSAVAQGPLIVTPPPATITPSSAVNGSGVTNAGLTFLSDNAFDIGASGATRPRTVYAGTSVIAPTFSATSAYQVNGLPFPAAAVSVGPSNPGGTTSLTLVMAGLAGSVTTQTGRLQLCASGNLSDATANDGTKTQISYGTGAKPANGDPVTGTQAGSIWQYNASTLAAGAQAPYGGCVIVTSLTSGTTYWFDMAFAAITGGTGSIASAYMDAHDIP